MIYIALKGGLGNQMFQLAAAYNLATEKKTQLSVITDEFKKEESEIYTKRSFELASVFVLEDIEIAKKKDYAYLLKNDLTSRIKKKLFNGIAYFEPNLQYQPTIKKLGRNTYLNGYFQSEQYFKKHQQSIKALFSFRKNLNKKTEDIVKIIQQKRTLAIHVRRGDYVTKQNINAIHGNLPLAYYKKALKNFELDKYNICFFSDDILWVKEKFGYLDARELTFVDWNHHTDAWQDLYLMSQCDDFIIANSSFSWWGAWLSEKPDKKIIAPKNWFKDKNLNQFTGDLIPDEWKQISETEKSF